MIIEAMKQALEVLDEVYAGKRDPQLTLSAAHNLRTAIQQAGAKTDETVAWISKTGHGTYFRQSITQELASLEHGGCKMWRPLVYGDTHPAPGVPYSDATPHLSVGDSAFESWYDQYLLSAPVHQSSKQKARDAYAAGMGDPLVQQHAPGVPDIEAAAKKLAECMDYPWEHMPEQGRANMRKHAESVLTAAQAQKGGE